MKGMGVALVASVGVAVLATVSMDAGRLKPPATYVQVADAGAGPSRPVSAGVAFQRSAAPAISPVKALVDGYCVGCHNSKVKTAGLALDTVDVNDVGGHAEIWEEAVRKLRGGLMPPPGARRPPAADVDAVVASLERSLDAAAEKNPNPGRVALHRLNRAEYAAEIDRLLGVKVDAAALLPKDDEADGFDNVASVLAVSPSFLEQYISAARVVTDLALGNPAAKPASVMYRPARGTDQSVHVEGLPLGTRGGLIARHLFPADGEYKLNLPGLAGAGYVRGMEYAHTVVVTVDGRQVFSATVGGEADLKAIDQQQAAAVAAINARFQNIPIQVTAGEHAIAATFIARTFAEPDELLHSFRPGAGEDRIPRINGLEIVGPFTTSGVRDTPSRERIFVCKPGASPARLREDEACASRILATLARAAYRRPATAADVDAPLQFYRAARGTGDFEAGIRAALPAILASPKFLYRAERTPAGTPAGTVHALNDYELAARLSFFLFGRGPDESLLRQAESGVLHTPARLARYLRDHISGPPPANADFTGFAMQWLKLRALEDAEPDAVLFPNFDDSLRAAFRREIELFVGSVFTEDLSVLRLLDADYTFVNERLALHYGISDVRGSHFRRVTLRDRNRWGLFGKGAVLTVTSYPNRTAPVLRGAWILENILGTPPAAPPPDVEGFPENKDGEKARTVREIMEQHRAQPACGSCHGVMDPLGFALENFDAVGEWRARDRWADTDIDASGRLIDGTAVSSPADLSAALLRRPQQFVQTFTEKLMTFALGRTLEHYDMPAVRKIVRDAAADQYRFSTIVRGIVMSAPFQTRRAAE